jgi:hypothetical protein
MIKAPNKKHIMYSDRAIKTNNLRYKARAAMSGELSEKTTENAINIIYGLIATQKR